MARDPAKRARNSRIYEAYRLGVKQNHIALVLGISRGRVHQIIVKIQRSVDGRPRMWNRAYKARPIELNGPRDVWMESTLERFDINARPPD